MNRVFLIKELSYNYYFRNKSNLDSRPFNVVRFESESLSYLKPMLDRVFPDENKNIHI